MYRFQCDCDGEWECDCEYGNVPPHFLIELMMLVDFVNPHLTNMENIHHPTGKWNSKGFDSIRFIANKFCCNGCKEQIDIC